MRDGFQDDDHRDSTVGPLPSCWSCRTRFEPREIRRDGILRSRRERDGGPYRLYTCPACFHLNLCERTPRGRWFSSPTFRPNIFEYLIGRLFLEDATDFIRAAAWYEENEERRRYFFERDGDRRYSETGIFGRLWPWTIHGGPVDFSRDPRDDETQRERDERERERAERERERERAERERSRASNGSFDRHVRVASPWAILGVRENASDAEVRRAFHRLAVQYHPDKVHHLGEEFQRVANEKFKELQRAYEAIRGKA